MRQTAGALKGATTIAAGCWGIVSQAALAPIDRFVDWLEAVYAGPAGSE
jgi:hypothetical protein